MGKRLGDVFETEWENADLWEIHGRGARDPQRALNAILRSLAIQWG